MLSFSPSLIPIAAVYAGEVNICNCANSSHLFTKLFSKSLFSVPLHSTFPPNLNFISPGSTAIHPPSTMLTVDMYLISISFTSPVNSKVPSLTTAESRTFSISSTAVMYTTVPSGAAVYSPFIVNSFSFLHETKSVMAKRMVRNFLIIVYC